MSTKISETELTNGQNKNNEFAAQNTTLIKFWNNFHKNETSKKSWWDNLTA